MTIPCSRLLYEAAPSQLLLLLLVSGHLLGDFLFQTRHMVGSKGRVRVLALHASVVTLVHLMVVYPFLTWSVAATVLGVGGSHALVDLVKARWSAERPGPLALFTLDQTTHLVVLIGAWLVLRDGAILRVSDPTASCFAAAGTLLGALAFNANGGSGIVEALLTPLKPGESGESEDSGLEGSGRLIGILERTLALILIVLGQWAAMVLLVAVKSIARFEELKTRAFAEYYLVGTLASLLIAVVTGLALRAVFL